jgi:hypothetical protein
LCYDIAFTVRNTVDEARVRVECGTFIGIWRDAFGTYTEQFTYDGISDVVFRFESFGAPAPNAYYIEIDDAILTVADECLDCSYNSNKFILGNHDCTHLVNVCNNEDGFGFIFNGSGFSPRIRLRSYLVRASYQSERDSFEDSAGKRTVQYFKRRKSKEWRIEPVPEYVHDFLSTIIGYDHVYIGSAEYFVDDDEYSLQYQTRNDVMASVTLKLSEKIQLVENTNCGADDNVCALTNEGYIGVPGMDGYVLATPGGVCINYPNG